MGDGLTKIIRLDDRFPGTGEPTVQIIDLANLSRIKVASDASEYIKTVKPVDGKTIVLVLAMSAGEWYGPNRNGDAFSERPVPGAVEPGETLVDHYKTFLSAHPFLHHQNRNPEKALGRVLEAFYNYDMHRVELLIELDNDKAASIVEKINDGQYPAVSMGCKIKYDVCAICGNKAPTRKEYCVHASHEMNRVYPDGSRAFVWNPSPQLFDISFVIRPADRIGYMMKKVASDTALELSADLGEKVADIEEKVSTLKKLSDMDKMVRGQTLDYEPKNKAVELFCKHTLPSIMANSPSLDDAAIGELANHSLPVSLSTLGAMGVTPTSAEITSMMTQRAMPGVRMPPAVLQRMSALSGGALNLLSEHPEILEELLRTGLLNVSQDKVNPQLANKLGAWMEKRSNLKEYLLRRAQPLLGEAHPDIGNWDTHNVTDPVTGKNYTTTQGALDSADDANVQRKLKTLAGAGLLAGAGYKALTAARGGKYMAPLALAAGALGVHQAGKRVNVPNVSNGTPQTADVISGLHWSGNTPINAEMRKVSNVLSIAAPMASSAAVTAMLAQEYNRRQAGGQLGATPGGPSRFIEGMGQVASRHPAAMFLAGLAGIGLAGHASGKLEAAISPFLKHSEENDDVKLAEVDLDGLSYWLGDSLF